MPKMTEERAIDKARREYEEEGRVEIDQKPEVSRGDNGYYVQAWVWVYDDEEEADEVDHYVSKDGLVCRYSDCANATDEQTTQPAVTCLLCRKSLGIT